MPKCTTRPTWTDSDGACKSSHCCRPTDQQQAKRRNVATFSILRFLIHLLSRAVAVQIPWSTSCSLWLLRQDSKIPRFPPIQTRLDGWCVGQDNGGLPGRSDQGGAGEGIIRDIRNEGFEHGAKRNRKLRSVDFNQGIDARLVTPKIADCSQQSI